MAYLSSTASRKSESFPVKKMAKQYGGAPYFFGYKMECFSFQNIPKNLDPSYKMDLDIWDCWGRVKLVLWHNFVGLIYLF